MYVAFEGVDTVGKSTQIERLAGRFEDCLVTKEPGGTPFGLRIRTMLLEEGAIHPRTEALLFLADRAEHIERIIRPNRHRLILSDRSLISGIAYAAVNEEIPMEELIALNRFATDGLYPDLAILFRIDRATLARRLSQKMPDAIEQRGIAYMLRVQEAMERVIETLGIDALFVDAGAPLESLTRQIETTIKERL